MARTEMEFPNLPAARLAYGVHEGNLKVLEQELGAVNLTAQGNIVKMVGEAPCVELAQKVLTVLYETASSGREITATDVCEQLSAIKGGAASSSNIVCMTSDKRAIRAKTPRQQAYVDAIRRDDIVFGIGPAGTGKTYLAMAMAVDALIRKKVKRIVLVRPAVEAGERLGFLPGDMAEKVNPYLRPLYDALYDMVDVDRAQHWIDQGTIEVAPLAFMRGRTLNSAFIIMDEAQNTTQEQMKMFLTRLGFGAKAVVTGDLTQSDLAADMKPGLAQAVRVLDGIDGISIVRLTQGDIVRHPLVQKIVLAYEKSEHSNGNHT